MSSIKDTLADIGIDTCMEFCAVNKIPQPSLTILRSEDEDTLDFKRIRRWATCGFYRNSEIKVAVPLCSHQSPMYSWPAYISDRTPFGVIQHELGHHVDEVFSGFNIYDTKSKKESFSDRLRKITKEKAITSYAPNNSEWFAEIFRLFVTNPDLLKKIRPLTYNQLLESGLEPIEKDDATTVLNRFCAKPHIFKRMENFIKASK